jgi:hypothetical protein
MASKRRLDGVKQHGRLARQASSGLYHAASAVILAWESVQAGGDPRSRIRTSRRWI